MEINLRQTIEIKIAHYMALIVSVSFLKWYYLGRTDKLSQKYLLRRTLGSGLFNAMP
jgi:hypothetical protein